MPLLVGAIIGEVLLYVGENLTHRGLLLGSTADGHTHESGVAVRWLDRTLCRSAAGDTWATGHRALGYILERLRGGLVQ